ncbi:MAG: hypothetical protein ACKVW3_04310 [Phycisphaerales bacterium]
MKKNVCVAAALALAAGLTQSVSAQTVQGPSTLQTPYMIPTDNAWGSVFYSIASNGNGVSAPNETFTRLNISPVVGNAPYRLVGIPDGTGVIRTPDDLTNGTMTWTVNQEIGATTGIVRDHGNRGSFVSLWKVRRDPTASNFLTVVGAQDLIQSVKLWDVPGAAFVTYNAASPMPRYNQTAANPGGWEANPNLDGIGRLCSADVAAPTAFFDPVSGLGTDARIHLAGEEIGASGRCFAHIITGPEAGTSYELPDYGDYSWENAVACPVPQAKTIVIGLDDATPGNLYVHIGTKQTSGTTVERAGLHTAKTYAISIAGTTVTTAPPIQAIEDRVNILGNTVSGPVSSKPFSLVELPNLRGTTGSQLQTLGDAAPYNQFNWLRPEDGAWDTVNPARFFFCTTDNFSGNSRLWTLEFTDISQPELGGTITMVADGSVPATFTGGIISATGITDVRMMDNLCMTKNGCLLIQEDVGNNVRLGRMWLYNPAVDSILDVGISDAARFLIGGTNYLGTQDEETSGVIDAEDAIGPGFHLLNMQAHYAIPGELVEGGQLMATRLPGVCYANCDGSTTSPQLNINDFNCFLNRFAAAQGLSVAEQIASYANCDGSNTAPVLNINDFQCYLNKFAAGCPQ